MFNLHDIPGTHYEQVPVPASAAGDASYLCAAWVAPFDCLVTSIEHVPSAAVTGNTTNRRNLNAQLAAGTEVGNLDYITGEDGVKGTPSAFTLSGTTAQLTLAAGATLIVQNELVSGGVALPLSNIRIGFRGV